MTTNLPSELRSICLFRLSALGDVTHVVPVVKTLQHRYPNLHITWVIGKLEYKLLKGLPGVDFVVFDKSEGWNGVKQLRQGFKGKRFDVLLQMQLSFRANLVSMFIPARRRVGFDKIRAKELHGLVVNERIPYLHDCHVLDGFMQFAEYLGCKERIMNWDIPVSQDDETFAHKLIDSNTRTVIVSPCSSHQWRNWTVSKYARLVDLIVERFAAQVLLTGGPSDYEKEFIGSIEAACQHPVQNIAGQDTLKQLLCLMKLSDLVVSPDSGPLHMAGAVGTPVIGLLAASYYRRSGSYQYPELTVDKYPEACLQYHNRPVSALKWGTKTEFPGAMDLIQVVDVMVKVEKVLAKGSSYPTKHK